MRKLPEARGKVTLKDWRASDWELGMASVSTSQAQEPHGMCDGTSTGQEEGWPECLKE